MTAPSLITVINKPPDILYPDQEETAIPVQKVGPSLHRNFHSNYSGAIQTVLANTERQKVNERSYKQQFFVLYEKFFACHFVRKHIRKYITSM